MKEPSKSQRQVISHLSGPVQVIAGPGSGKTFAIIQRICCLIRHYHVRPDRILVVTYTKAAANEMKERYEAACMSNIAPPNVSQSDNYSSASVNFGTFHSICYNILRRSGSFKSDSLIKESDKRKLLQVILGNHGLASKCSYDVITGLQNTISRMKNSPEAGEKTGESGTDFSHSELILIREEYDRYLREQGLLDFDDMITECLTLFSSSQQALSTYQKMFEYILVDEFQDINPPQYQVIKLLAAPSHNLMVVGDDDQSIYGFRGATPGIMKRFMEDYSHGKQLLLTENFRSGSRIVELAGNMISRNQERFEKEFHPVRDGGKVTFVCFDTRKEEEAGLIAELSSLPKEQLADTAVILRTNLEVMQYLGLLKEAGIGVKGKCIKETDMFHGFIMEDITAFLSFLYEGNKRGDFIQFMNKPNRFLTRTALPLERVNVRQLERYYAQNPSMLGMVRVFFGQLKIAAGLSPHLAVTFFRKTLEYDKYLRQKAKDYREYLRFLEQADKIRQCFQSFQLKTSVRDFVELQADAQGRAVPEMRQEQGVSILTMHGAKGLEFTRVFIPDVNDGVIPGRECISEHASLSSLEEERRLLYVAITRARDELFIYCTGERGRKLSRFLDGLIPLP